MPRDRGRPMAIHGNLSGRSSSIKPEGDNGLSPENHLANKSRTRGSSEPRTPQQTHQQQEQRFGKRGSGQAFALGLFQILKTEDPKIIGWSPSGKAFRIGDSEKFCKDIMPRFFKQNKYSSFQRQLNLYGFRKLVRGNEAGGYMHPLFERGKPEQLSQVRRGYFPDIPPEFAHDVHGHGLDSSSNSTADAGSNNIHHGDVNLGSSRGQRGRKSETSVQDMGFYRGSRSTSVGPMSRSGVLAQAARAAVDVVNMAAVPMDTEWDPSRGRLPSLRKIVRGGMNMNGVVREGPGGRQGGAAEMPPTLERLVSSADTGLSRESSPMKPTSNGNRHNINGGTGGTGCVPLSMSNAPQMIAPPTPQNGQNGLPAYGRSQDDLNLTPRSHFANAPMMGMGMGLGSFNDFSPSNSFQESSFHGQQAHDLIVANNRNRPQHGNANGSSPRVLQQTHSRDDLDALRPYKTRRRTVPNADDHLATQQQPFPATVLLPRRAPGGGYPINPSSASGYGAGVLDEPPAPPGRLGFGNNTPSRPESSSTSSTKNGVDGGSRGLLPRMSLSNPSTSSAMGREEEGVLGGSGGSLVVNHPSDLGKHGFFPAMSPVTVAPKVFPGERMPRHQRHPSGGGGGGGGGGQGWRLGEVTPEHPAALTGGSPSSTRSGGSGGGGVGLTRDAINRMEQVKPNPGVQGVPGALDRDLSQLNLSKVSTEELSRQQQQHHRHMQKIHQQQAGDAAGSNGISHLNQAKQSQLQQQMQAHSNRTQRQQQQQSSGGSGVPNHTRDVSGGGGSGRKLTAPDAAELLRRRSSVDEVIGLLSLPPNGSVDGGFEDEGARMQNCDAAQFDSWRNSLTKVLGHLGFDLEDEQGVPLMYGKQSPDGHSGSARGPSQFLSWGGTSAMSFEERPEEFQESLKQIPVSWRSSLSSIMTSMASNGAFDDNGTQGNSTGEGGTVDMDVAGGGKRLEQQASLEMLQSVMRETLESVSGSQDQVGADGEDETKAAATAALAMGSMCRDKANGRGNALGGGELGSDGGRGGRSGRSYPRGDVAVAVPGGDVSVTVPTGGRSGYYGQQEGYNHEHTTF